MTREREHQSASVRTPPTSAGSGRAARPHRRGPQRRRRDDRRRSMPAQSFAAAFRNVRTRRSWSRCSMVSASANKRSSASYRRCDVRREAGRPVRWGSVVWCFADGFMIAPAILPSNRHRFPNTSLTSSVCRWSASLHSQKAPRVVRPRLPGATDRDQFHHS